MSFLGALGSQISSQFSLGENTTNSLDSVIDGQNVKFGSLGDFSQKFDQSAERRYLEEGYLRKDPYNADPKQLEVLMQQPDATVLVKKKMFGSIGDNYRPDLMDKDEKMYFKAMKILFQNKCRQIAALESLSKIQKITSALGTVDAALMPIVFSLSDDAGLSGTLNGKFDPNAFGDNKNDSSMFGSGGGGTDDFAKTIDRVRRIYTFNQTTNTTSWITDNSNLWRSQFGEGTGVIELTNFTNLSTSVTTNISSPGNFSLNIVDPYEAMVITEYDIEKALSDATNLFNNHKIFQFGQAGAGDIIADFTNRLNSRRSARGASSISFKINPDTILGKRVRAIIDRIGVEIQFTQDALAQFSSVSALFSGGSAGVEVPPEYLKGGEIAGFDGLASDKQKFGELKLGFLGTIGPHEGNESELSIFKNLVTAIFNKLTLDANSKNAFQTSNKNTNYARRKLRFNFGGQLIVQPMDSVHIYLSSKSKYDNHLLGGLKDFFTGVNVLQTFGNAITDLSNQITTLFNPTGGIEFQMEKTAFVGPDFPNFLWGIIRNQFVNEQEGTHVFAGVVDSVNNKWSDGKFTVSIGGKDNSYYLTLGKINFKPGADTFNGSFFDPLTPFKSKFDTVSSNFKGDSPELLDENKIILGEKSGKTLADKKTLVKNKSGPNAGKSATALNYIQDRTIDPNTKRFIKTFYAPDGLVYKWKEGIGIFTKFGGESDTYSPSQVGAPNIAKDPFSGQDVMNVVSLLITGVPYNFATYLKATQNINGFARDPHSGQDASHSYYESLKNDLIKTNTTWGNFVPFKNLVMDEQSFATAINTLVSIKDANAQIDSKIESLRNLENDATTLGLHAFNADGATVGPTKSQTDEINTLSSKLSSEIFDLSSKIKDQNKDFFVMVGDDVSFDYDEFSNQDSQTAAKSASNPHLRRLLRRQINNLTRRMSYNVRANEDKNLFIVDDYYDKDYDIAAFNSELSGEALQIFSNDFLVTKDKIKAAVEPLNLEVFCDTQGHIRVRPPQYNRMPSSVFYRMMYLKKTFGVQVFPQFLEDLFSTQLKTLRERLEVIEDQIRLDCAVLGSTNDFRDVEIITDNSNSSTGGGIDGQGAAFNYISNSKGYISYISDAITAATPDIIAASQNNDLKESVFSQASSTKDVFTNAQRADFLQNALIEAGSGNSGALLNSTLQLNDSRISDLIKRIQNKSGQKITQDYFFTASVVVSKRYLDVFKITKDLSAKLSERQKVLKLFASTLKNITEYRSLDDSDSQDKTANDLLLPGTFGNKDIPEVFEHMIEDESYDDYGVNSGKRFVIKNSQIKEYDFKTEPPEYTHVQVNGQIPFVSEAGLPPGLNAFPNSGNALVSALAVDYDTWRAYGAITQQTITVPFLSDPQSQVGPYAASILSRARRNILQGSITIAGNEFMQPGEVVFIESRGLLFYVTAVRHSYTQGSVFNTSLDLKYGHVPGEYIPTTLDVVGKVLYNNKDIASYQIQRQSSSFDESNLGIIINDPNNLNGMLSDLKSALSSSKSTQPGGASYGPANAATINNILFSTAYKVNANQSTSSNVKASIQLRIYFDSTITVANDDLQKYATYISDIMVGTNTMESTQNAKLITLPKGSVDIVTIDLSDINVPNSPSQKAWDAARNIVSNTSIIVSTSGSDEKDPGLTPDQVKPERDKLRTALCKYVIDCWIKFENVPVTTNG